jgi:hypothetical protein
MEICGWGSYIKIILISASWKISQSAFSSGRIKEGKFQLYFLEKLILLKDVKGTVQFSVVEPEP